jgi:dethiobiotin synthetase
MASRPKQLIGLLGTQTEIGKTWIAAQLLSQARAKGLRVAARKPVQSFEPDQGPTDAEQLAAATGEQPTEVCPKHRNYPLPLAPPMAADVLQRPRIALDELIAEITWPENLDIGLVETVGGPRSPLSHDADSVDLIKRLKPDLVLLVADAGLGTLNAVRLSLPSIEPLMATVLLNRFDATNDLHRMNRDWLAQRYSVRVVTDVAELLQARA